MLPEKEVIDSGILDDFWVLFPAKTDNPGAAKELIMFKAIIFIDFVYSNEQFFFLENRTAGAQPL